MKSISVYLGQWKNVVLLPILAMTILSGCNEKKQFAELIVPVDSSIVSDVDLQDQQEIINDNEDDTVTNTDTPVQQPSCEDLGNCPPKTCEELGNCPTPSCEELGNCPPKTCEELGNCPPKTCEELGNCPPKTCEELGNCPPPSCEDLGNCPPPSCEELGNCPPKTCEELGNCPPPSCEDLGNCPPPTCEELGNCPPKTNTNSETFSQKVKLDILWVVDNSASMKDEHAKVVENINILKNQVLDSENIDFKMAFTTTYTGWNRISNGKTGRRKRFNMPSESIRSAAELSTIGLMIGDESILNSDYLTGGRTAQETAQRTQIFNTMVANSISFRNDAGQLELENRTVEKGLEASTTFLQRYHTNRTSNKWLRDDAYLIVIYISDEDDFSTCALSDTETETFSRKPDNCRVLDDTSGFSKSPADYYTELTNFKNGNQGKLKIITVTSAFGSLGFDKTRYSQLSELAGGEEITSSQIPSTVSGYARLPDSGNSAAFTNLLSNLGDRISSLTRVFYLEKSPLTPVYLNMGVTLEVNLGTGSSNFGQGQYLILGQDYEYHESQNAIKLIKESIIPTDREWRVKIEYRY
ncbi:hypothetical protein OAB57_00115 [Bacteriovoracaceae bacterium]|nr:hypothetical protein [Bacteriovoracaceae bacterium]